MHLHETPLLLTFLQSTLHHTGIALALALALALPLPNFTIHQINRPPAIQSAEHHMQTD
jgi:hypothetical protein